MKVEPNKGIVKIIRIGNKNYKIEHIGYTDHQNKKYCLYSQRIIGRFKLWWILVDWETNIDDLKEQIKRKKRDYEFNLNKKLEGVVDLSDLK